MRTAREIAARVWCDPEMSKVAMDVDAAEQIAIIIQSIREEQAGPVGIPNRRNFDDELVCLLNKYSKENGSNTPDFILADYIGRCLENWNLTVVNREEWYGRTFSPGSLKHDIHVCEHGVKDGDWCEPCNKAMKAAAAICERCDRPLEKGRCPDCSPLPLTLKEDGTFERMDEPGESNG